MKDGARDAVRLCVRGNPGPWDRTGHCTCADCKAFNYARQKASRSDGVYRRAYYLRNKGKVGDYSKKWNAANRTQRRSIEKDWRARNPEKVAAMSAKAGKKWTENNRGKRNAITAARRAAIRLRLPVWADREAIKAFYVAAAEETARTGVPHEVDHIIPLQGEHVSGLHVETNLRVIPRQENRSKKNAWGGVSEF